MLPANEIPLFRERNPHLSCLQTATETLSGG